MKLELVPFEILLMLYINKEYMTARLYVCIGDFTYSIHTNYNAEK